MGGQPTVGDQAVDGGHESLGMGHRDVERDLSQQAFAVDEGGPA